MYYICNCAGHLTYLVILHIVIGIGLTSNYKIGLLNWLFFWFSVRIASILVARGIALGGGDIPDKGVPGFHYL